MKNKPKHAVLGAGNGGYALSSDLALSGFEVHLFELEQFRENIISIEKRGGIMREGIRPGFARLRKVTTDIKEAVKGVDVINITIPAYAHNTFIETLAPNLEDGQIVVIWPCNWGPIKLRRYMKEKGIEKKVVIAGGVTMPYACRRMRKPAYIFVRTSRGIPVAAMPAEDTIKAIDAMKQYPFPVIPGKNVIEISINYGNPLSHIPMMLLNAASIERTKGEYSIFYTVDGVLSSQELLEKALLTERIAICKALRVRDYKVEPLPAGSNPEPAVPSNLKSYWHMTKTLNYRYLTEDIPYGLVTWSSLGDLLGVSTPVMKACITLSSILLNTNFWKKGLTVEKLGFCGLSAEEIEKLVTI